MVEMADRRTVKLTKANLFIFYIDYSDNILT